MPSKINLATVNELEIEIILLCVTRITHSIDLRKNSTHVHISWVERG